jgi:hypothetical protein
MESFTSLTEKHPALVPILVILFLWEAVWKLIAMWKAGRNNQMVWFIVIAIVNTLGILPIVYILFSRKQKPVQ